MSITHVQARVINFTVKWRSSPDYIYDEIQDPDLSSLPHRGVRAEIHNRYQGAIFVPPCAAVGSMRVLATKPM